MFCPKCGKPIKETDSFCPYCGRNLVSKNTNKKDVKTYKSLNKKQQTIIGISFSLIIVVAGLSAYFLFGKTSNEKSYDDYVKLGKEYYDDEQYDLAEDSFKKAYQFDEKQEEPYTYLKNIYEIENEQEKAKEIDTSAKENLSKEDYQDYQEEQISLAAQSSGNSEEENTSDVDEEEEKISQPSKASGSEEENSKDDTDSTKKTYKSVEEVEITLTATKYSTINDNVTSFTSTPIDYGKYYITQKDELYSFIGTDNKVIKGDFEKVVLSTDSEKKAIACGFTSSTDKEGVNSDGKTCKVDTSKEEEKGYFYLDSDGKTIKTASADEDSTYSVSDVSTPIVVRKGKDASSTSDYYIYVPSTGKLEGPYKSDVYASFNVKVDKLYDKSSSQGIILDAYGKDNNTNVVIKGLYYVKDGDKYVVYSADGTKKTDISFDSAEPLSNTAMKVTKDGKTGVLDENLKLVLYGDFKDVSLPIDKKCYVKIKDKWALIDLSEVKSTSSTSSTTQDTTSNKQTTESKLDFNKNGLVALMECSAKDLQDKYLSVSRAGHEMGDKEFYGYTLKQDSSVDYLEGYFDESLSSNTSQTPYMMSFTVGPVKLYSTFKICDDLTFASSQDDLQNLGCELLESDEEEVVYTYEKYGYLFTIVYDYELDCVYQVQIEIEE